MAITKKNTMPIIYLIIYLKVNGLNSTIKRHKVT